MPNRLAEETSPYLRQHADNPVDWFAWGDEALAKARTENKPILLSIGYSACHWCHVMAHESFEDEATAALMNARYVNIKVDREERPDLDKVYQMAHQIMTQRPGGWPLTVMLDPQHHAPFMAGTYFPPTAKHGMPAFSDVLRQVADWFEQNQHKLDEQKQRLGEVFARLDPDPAATLPGDTASAAAREQLTAHFDSEHGGFTGAPKFPHPSSLELLLRLAHDGDEVAGDMARFSLMRICAGGLFDHIGGGFYRYAVDAAWSIPHFEKMLYDNGPLLALAASQARQTGQQLFHDAAHATADWVLREMQAADGGYYASLDADSEGEEGRFYTWHREQVRALLDAAAYTPFAHRYGLDRPANFEGRWHLQHQGKLADTATLAGLDERQLGARLDAARQHLFEAREQRPRPGRDEKVLTAWNALMIQGMATAYRHLERKDCLQSARAARDFIHGRLWQGDRLLAVYKDGQAHQMAYLDDYAFLLDALLELLQAHWHSADLHWATALADALLAHFEDSENGGFYFTAHDHERLLHRPKPLGDESTPSGNAVAARGLIRLGYLIGETRYLDAAERCLKLATPTMTRYPLAHMSLIQALLDYRHPPETIILRGDQASLNKLRLHGDDARLLFAIPNDATDLPPALAAKQSRAGITAYVCHGHSCSAPVTGTQAIKELIL